MSIDDPKKINFMQWFENNYPNQKNAKNVRMGLSCVIFVTEKELFNVMIAIRQMTIFAMTIVIAITDIMNVMNAMVKELLIVNIA